LPVGPERVVLQTFVDTELDVLQSGRALVDRVTRSAH
jgi:hypothetical protein